MAWKQSQGITMEKTWNMSVEEEAEILALFQPRAETREIVEVNEIRNSYHAAVDHPIGNNRIYCLLRHHGWRNDAMTVLTPMRIFSYFNPHSLQKITHFVNSFDISKILYIRSAQSRLYPTLQAALPVI